MELVRVISGVAKGFRLKAPSGRDTRPTLDAVKESLFNIIRRYTELENSVVLDLYAGTGSLGIEALSRGALYCTFIDKKKICGNIIEQNLDHTQLSEKARTIIKPVIDGIKMLGQEEKVFDIVFVDPPYLSISVEQILGQIVYNDILTSSAVVVIEHDISSDAPEKLSDLKLETRRDYRHTALSFYKRY